MKNFETIFKTRKPIIAVLHLYGDSKHSVYEVAKQDIEQLYENGADAVLVEDYFGTPDDVEWTLNYLDNNYSGCVYGVNLLRDEQWSFVMAKQYGAAFIQIDSVCGHLKSRNNESCNNAHNRRVFDDDYEKWINQMRQEYHIYLFGGVRFKYQPVKTGRSIYEDIRKGKDRCDAIVVSGNATGEAPSLEKIVTFRDVIRDYPLLVGSGMTEENCEDLLRITDGAIVGSFFKKDGIIDGCIDPLRVKRLMDVVKHVRNK